MTRWLLLMVLAAAPLQDVPRPADRFDMLVRNDFFAGFAGDSARLKRAMERCEQALAANPRHAEALVWHGTGLVFLAGGAFGSGDWPRAQGQLDRGLKEMNEAVAMAPENVGVLIPRGATLLQVSHSMPGAGARTLLSQAVADYEKVLALQMPYFDRLGDHPRGELLFGLAEGHLRLGDVDRARMYFNRLVKEAPSSGQTLRARTWLETGSVPKTDGRSCVGCHK
jgi:tetratricopeptide (TPR) repeat protein